MPSSSSPTAQLFADLDADKMNMNAEDIDRLLRDGLTSMGLEALLDDDCDVESSSPQSIITSSTAPPSGTLWSNPHVHPQPRPRPNHMDVLSQIGAWNNATGNNDGTSSFSAPEADDDFILTSVGVTTTSGITTESSTCTSSSTAQSIVSTTSATASSAESEHNEHILQQLLLSSSSSSSSPGYNSTMMTSSTSSSYSDETNNDEDINEEDDVLSAEIARLVALGTSGAGKSPTSLAKFPSPTQMAALDRHYKEILDDLRDQMRPLEEAPILEYGMAWNDLLDTVLSSIFPLADVPDPARGQGQDVQGQNQEDKEAVSPIPRRHYQPLLLECALIWRRSVKEAIERNEEEIRKAGKDGKAKYYSNSLLRWKDRHFLVQQASRIVERYLTLHRVFPEDQDAGFISAVVDADTGSKVRTHECISVSFCFAFAS